MSFERGSTMKERFIKMSLIIMIIMIIVGFLLILFSYSIGHKIGSETVRQGNGITVTTQDPRIIEANTNNFRIVGSILSLIGGFGMLLCGYIIYKEL